MAAATVNAAEILTDMGRIWVGSAMRDLIEHSNPYCFPLCCAQKFTIPATSVNDVGDIVRLFQFPTGAYIWVWRSTPSDMDTGGSPALIYDIVATNDSDAVQLTIVSGSTKAQAASGSDIIIDAVRGRYVGGYWCAMKTTTAATTAAAGTLKCAWEMSIGVINRNKRGTYLGDAES